jgi:zinc and cadmium transporter
MDLGGDVGFCYNAEIYFILVIMNNWLYAVIAVVLVSLISLIGVFTFVIKDKWLKKITTLLVALSAGTLLGDVFLHILPEGFEHLDEHVVSFGIIGGILLFYILENILNWKHCHIHEEGHHNHGLATTNLVGDALHNFIDGLIIASSFAVSLEVGIASSLAIVLHEVPQEVGDFGVLIYSGMKKGKAILFNLLSGLFAVLGLVVFYILGDVVEPLSDVILMVAGGGFLYIAIADLIPEMRHTCSKKRTLLNILFMVIGICIMFGLGLMGGHSH